MHNKFSLNIHVILWTKLFENRKNTFIVIPNKKFKKNFFLLILYKVVFNKMSKYHYFFYRLQIFLHLCFVTINFTCSQHVILYYQSS